MQALGVDIQTIQSIVGHADTEMTAHDFHVQESIRQSAVQLFSEAFSAWKSVSFFCRSITLALLNFCVFSHLHCSVRLTQVALSADTANTTGGSGNRAARCVRL